MSTFYKVYNTLDNYWKRVIYKLSKDSTVLELFDVVGSYEMIKCKHYPVCDGLRQDFEVI